MVSCGLFIVIVKALDYCNPPKYVECSVQVLTSRVYSDCV
jgi:hypothetical protein